MRVSYKMKVILIVALLLRKICFWNLGLFLNELFDYIHTISKFRSYIFKKRLFILFYIIKCSLLTSSSIILIIHKSAIKRKFCYLLECSMIHLFRTFICSLFILKTKLWLIWLDLSKMGVNVGIWLKSLLLKYTVLFSVSFHSIYHNICLSNEVWMNLVGDHCL